MWSVVAMVAIVSAVLVVYAGFPELRVALPRAAMVTSHPVTAANGASSDTIEVVPPQYPVDVYDDTPLVPGARSPAPSDSTTESTDAPSPASGTIDGQPGAPAGTTAPAPPGSNAPVTTTTEAGDEQGSWTPTSTTTPVAPPGTDSGPAPADQ